MRDLEVTLGDDVLAAASLSRAHPPMAADRELIAPDALTWLSAAQRDLCCYCGCETWLPWQRKQEARLRARWDMPGARSMACQLAFGYRMASVEHLRRRADGGGDAPGNLAMACAYCNSSRRDASPEGHAAAMRDLVAAGRHPCSPGRAAVERPQDDPQG